MPNKERYQKDKEKYKEYSKQHRLNNKEHYIEYRKQHRKTPSGKKTHIISSWKSKGIIDEDLPAVYDYYIKQTNCMICLKQFKTTKDRHLDHNHKITDAPNIRYICCNICNTKLLSEKYNI